MKNALNFSITFFLLLLLPSSGSTQVVVNSTWENQYIEPTIQILPIKSGETADSTNILRGTLDAQFMPFDAKFVTGKETANWLKLTIENASKQQKIYIGTSRFEYMTCWIKTDSSVTGPFYSGQKVAEDLKPVKIVGLSFFSFDLPQGKKTTVYLKAVNKDAPIVPQQVTPLLLANEKHFYENYQKTGDYTYMFLGALLIMAVFNSLLYLTTKIKTYLYYSLFVIFVMFFALGLIPQFAYPLYGHTDITKLPITAFGSIATIFYILVAQNLLEIKKYYPKGYKFLNVLIGLLCLALVSMVFDNLVVVTAILNFATSFTLYPTLLVIGFLMVLKRHIPSIFFFIAFICFITGITILLLSLTNVIPPVIFGISGVTFYQVSLILEATLFSLGIGVRINEMGYLKNQEALERLRAEQLTMENEEINLQRTKAENALKELKITQDQLIQKEKLASLGELTAGIAHEIQNPLNFVNNFSELSVDLAKDLSDELAKPDMDKVYIEELLTDLSQNQEKISHHGKRASNIVKGMLEHSRASTGNKELTDINRLVDESLRLSYHGLRAKNKEFNATINTHFQDTLPKIEVVPQDIGRVLLNLINNAFYAVNQRATAPQPPEGENYVETYMPTVIVSTHYEAPPSGVGGHIIITVKDNGTGMPESVKAKVFQPFFTTKPTGQGTGLGLSLAHDIVTKGHGGTLAVESTEGVGTEFIIRLPRAL